MPQRIAFIIWISFFLSSVACGRNIDSLKHALAHAAHDSEKVSLHIAISRAIKAIDSADKVKYAFNGLAIAKDMRSAKHLMDCYQNLGRIYCYSLKNNRAAVDYFMLYETTAMRNKDTARQVDALSNLMVVSFHLSEFFSGLDYGRRALQLCTTKDMEVGLLGNMGQIYLAVADYPKAMDYYTRSLKAKEQDIIARMDSANANDTMHLALLLLSIGDVYEKMKEYGKAIDNYEQAIVFSKENPGISIMSLIGKATVFENTGNYAAAARMYGDALAITKKRDHDNHQTKIFTALAKIYLKRKDAGTARIYADSALALAVKYKETAMLPDIYIILARLDEGNKKYHHAVSYLLNAVKIAQEIGILEAHADALQMLSETYKSMNKPSEALDAYRQYIVIRDSIYNIDKAKELTRMDIESQYATVRLGDSVKNAQQAAIYEADIQKQKVVKVSALAGVGMLVILSFFIYRNYAQEKKTNVIISKANEEIQAEKLVSEGLLLNILPEEVAKELKARGVVQPRLFENVTVFFSDFVNFTVAGDKLSPQELVEELHECFKAFDAIMSTHGIEKIKTVGDAYLAVSGLPEPNPNHAADIVNAALEVRDFMRERRILMGDRTFGIRIGINSGPVVAGIVGVKKFAYDIWGDTVNVAARMEQNSEDGKINISEKTRDLVGGNFSLTDRGSLAAKNKGVMKMYFAEPSGVTYVLDNNNGDPQIEGLQKQNIDAKSNY